MIKCNFIFCPTTDWNRPVYIVQDCFSKVYLTKKFKSWQSDGPSQRSLKTLFVSRRILIYCLVFKPDDSQGLNPTGF